MADELRKGPSGPPVSLDTDSIINESELPGATVTDVFNLMNEAGTAIPAGFPPEDDGSSNPSTAGLPGYTSRRCYVNAASSRIGTTFAGVTVEAAPAAWLTEADLPPGNDFTITQYGAAAGSGSGCAVRAASGTSSFNGGGPSGGGAINTWKASRNALIAALPIFFDVPLGGLGGDSVVGNSITATDGNPGLSPTSVCSITGTGIFEIAGNGFPGGPGVLNGTGTAGSGGGRFGSATSSTVGGLPGDASATVANVVFNNLGGARSNTRTSTGSSGTMQWSICGGAGGGSNIASNTTVHGGRSKYGGCGGGHGGRFAQASGTIIQASDGGNHDVTLTGNPGGGGGGAAGTANGEAGQNGADGNEFCAGEGGGGGMAASGDSIATTRGGAGGEGGFPGGGSGGGGGAFSSTAAVNSLSGPGRKGGDAAILITGY